MKFYRPRQIFESEPCKDCDYCPEFCGIDMDACMRGRKPKELKTKEMERYKDIQIDRQELIECGFSLSSLRTKKKHPIDKQ